MNESNKITIFRQSAQDFYPNLKIWYDSSNDFNFSDFKRKSHSIVRWICPNLGHKFTRSIASHTKIQTCPYCKMAFQKSEIELRILFELKYFFPSISPFSFNPIRDRKYRADIYIPEKNTIIEYDGFFWHKDREVKDLEKINLFLKNGYNVIRLREYPLIKNFKNDFIVLQKNNYEEKLLLVKNCIENILLNVGIDMKEISYYMKYDGFINEKTYNNFINSLQIFNILGDEQLKILKELYIEQNLTYKNVCNKMNISHAIFYKNTKFYGIKKDRSKNNSSSYYKNIDKETLKSMYESDILLEDIATIFDISITAVRSRFTEYNLWNEIDSGKNRATAQSLRQKKPVIQKTIDGEFVQRFDSIKEASMQTNINTTSLNHCLKKYRNQQTAGGYIWEYISKPSFLH